MANDKQAPKELKVTDKRIFTPEGEIREEFQNDIRPADAQEINPTEPRRTAPDPASQQPSGSAARASEAPKPASAAPRAAPEPPAERRQEQQSRPPGEERRRSIADKATNPETPFTNFIEPLIAQGYMSLGMLRNPYQPQAKIDTAAARQMIEILTLLKEKTKGNLTPEEEDFMETHLGELKLAFVQRTKTI